jgi:hypothetical protein
MLSPFVAYKQIKACEYRVEEGKEGEKRAESPFGSLLLSLP